jgi:cobalt-zinc-cadmium resistance protein CzcA
MNAIQQRQKAQWSLGPTQFEYQYGQINFEGKDRYLSFSQSIPNPLKMKKGSNALQAELQYTQAGNHLYQRQMLRNLRLQYDAWLFYFENIQVLDSSLYWINQAVEHSELMRVKGLLNPTELLPLKSLQTNHLQRRMAMQQKRYEAEIALQLMLAVSAPITTDDQFQMLDASITGDSISNVVKSFYQEGTSLFEKQLEKERSNLLPDLQLGYFQQSLNLSPGFSGWFAGLEIPLFQRANYKQIKVVQLKAEQFLLQKEQELGAARLQIEQLKQRISELVAALSTSKNDQMAPFLLLQLQSGLINTTEASVLLAQQANNQLDRLELIFMHNQNLIQLQYHVQNK